VRLNRQADQDYGMGTHLLKDSVGWGVVLWLIGYILGIVLFFVVPPSLIGWVIMPVGITITLWILLRRLQAHVFGYYVIVAFVWTLIAVVCDYFFIVKAFSPTDGYYKLDVYLYYALTFILPLAAAWRKTSRADSEVVV
jgi:hypothetical protein